MLGGKVGEAADFEIDGVRFSSGFVAPRGDVNAFTLVKSADLVTRYERLLEQARACRIVELGIAYGGSTAFLAMRARPRKLVAIEFESARLAHLDRFIDDRELGAVVRPYYGVDQGDKDRVGAILADEFGDEPLDLVFDDASHRYGPTLASFETIFPSLRPGGVYIIEDWRGLHELAAALERRLAEDEPDKGRRSRREHQRSTRAARWARNSVVAAGCGVHSRRGDRRRRHRRGVCESSLDCCPSRIGAAAR